MKTPQSLRLTLRELFLLVGLIAAVAGWWREHQLLAPVRQACNEIAASKPVKNLDTDYVPLGIQFGEYQGVHYQITAFEPVLWEKVGPQFEKMMPKK